MKKKEFDQQFLSEHDSIYSSVPEFFKLKTDSEKVLFIKKDKVRQWFLAHKGKKNAVPLNNISNTLGFRPTGNCVDFRHIVAKLVEEDYFPIVSSAKGYYYPSTSNDIGANITQEENRVSGIKRRINALHTIQRRFQRTEIELGRFQK